MRHRRLASTHIMLYHYQPPRRRRQAMPMHPLLALALEVEEACLIPQVIPTKARQIIMRSFTTLPTPILRSSSSSRVPTGNLCRHCTFTSIISNNSHRPLQLNTNLELPLPGCVRPRRRRLPLLDTACPTR